ncbi:MAG: hypothetical protein IBJ00_06470 [Alphaproteobacteria bacterium]|nr:hypothetical protein [Alphaproteobacteria bacterium]
MKIAFISLISAIISISQPIILKPSLGSTSPPEEQPEHNSHLLPINDTTSGYSPQLQPGAYEIMDVSKTSAPLPSANTRESTYNQDFYNPEFLKFLKEQGLMETSVTPRLPSLLSHSEADVSTSTTSYSSFEFLDNSRNYAAPIFDAGEIRTAIQAVIEGESSKKRKTAQAFPSVAADHSSSIVQAATLYPLRDEVVAQGSEENTHHQSSLNDEQILALAEGLSRLPVEETINFSGKNLDDDQTRVILDGIISKFYCGRATSHLIINLSQNFITPKCLPELTLVLKSYPLLQQFDLSCNYLGQQELTAALNIKLSLQLRTTQLGSDPLIQLDLSRNNFTPADASSLKECETSFRKVIVDPLANELSLKPLPSRLPYTSTEKKALKPEIMRLLVTTYPKGPHKDKCYSLTKIRKELKELAKKREISRAPDITTLRSIIEEDAELKQIYEETQSSRVTTENFRGIARRTKANRSHHKDENLTSS